MTALLVEFLACAAVVVAAGIVLVRAADAIAEATGWGRLLVGSVFLAAATSLPELFVDLTAVRIGAVDLAVGDLMGAGLMNLAVLACADLLRQSRGKLFSRSSAAHALSATASITLIGLAGAFVLSGIEVEIFGLGLGPLAILCGWLLGLRLVYYDQRQAAEAISEERPRPRDRRALRGPLVQYAVAVAMLAVAAPRLAETAEGIAELSGLGSTFFGTTAVAFCTTLPETVATLTAVRAGAFDLAAGNIFGSNAFNMVILVPLDLVAEGPLLATVSPDHALTALFVMITTAVFVMGQLYRVEKRVWLIEPDAAVVITLVLGALGILYLRS